MMKSSAVTILLITFGVITIESAPQGTVGSGIVPNNPEPLVSGSVQIPNPLNTTPTGQGALGLNSFNPAAIAQFLANQNPGNPLNTTPNGQGALGLNSISPAALQQWLASQGLLPNAQVGANVPQVNPLIPNLSQLNPLNLLNPNQLSTGVGASNVPASNQAGVFGQLFPTGGNNPLSGLLQAFNPTNFIPALGSSGSNGNPLGGNSPLSGLLQTFNPTNLIPALGAPVNTFGQDLLNFASQGLARLTFQPTRT